jgi:hypothetical protein
MLERIIINTTTPQRFICCSTGRSSCHVVILLTVKALITRRIIWLRVLALNY